jgi:hypothetical protein
MKLVDRSGASAGLSGRGGALGRADDVSPGENSRQVGRAELVAQGRAEEVTQLGDGELGRSQRESDSRVREPLG